MTLYPNTTALNRRGLTAIEVLLVLCVTLFVVFLVAFGWLSSLSGSHRAPMPRCAANLKQVSLAYILWAEDNHTTTFPWEVQSGTLTYATSRDVFRHLAVVSNQLATPKALICPSDKARKPAASWSDLRNANISYFLSVTQMTNQQDIISGDRHLSTNHNILSGYYEISDPTRLRWTKDIHPEVGNVALADGSVRRDSTSGVQSRFTNLPVRLAIP